MFVYSLIYVIMEPKEFAKIVGGSEVFTKPPYAFFTVAIDLFMPNLLHTILHTVHKSVLRSYRVLPPVVDPHI